MNVQKSECVPSEHCDEKYYGNAKTNQCSPCDKSCDHCTGPAENQCTACQKGFYLDPLTKKCVEKGQCSGGYYSFDWRYGTCVKLCPNRVFYEDKNSKHCERCHASCVDCSGPTANECTHCYTPKQFLNPKTNTCIDNCKDFDANSYGNGQTTRCELCWSHETSKCKTCRGAGEHECETCYDGFVFDSGRCSPFAMVG